MSDPTTTTTQQPNAGASQDGGQQNDAQPAGQTTQPAQPFAIFETAEAFKKRVDRESRKALNQQAKALGYEDWQEMSEALQPLRRGGDTPSAGAQQPDKQQPAQPQGPSEVERLRMALNVGQKLNLPAALVGRLQGTTPEEMEADAQALMGLFAAGQARGPGILPAPQTNQPTTFTRAQLQDPEFVRKNAQAIMEAHRQGRIVNS